MEFSSLIRWVYCLNVSWILIFAFTGSLVFFRLRNALAPGRLWRSLCILCLLVWAAVVVQVTLLGRSPEPVRMPPEPLFQSYRKLLNSEDLEIFRSNFMNLFLFFPAGMLLVPLMPRFRHPWMSCAAAAAILILFSIGIEYCQYRCQLGRTEADDVFHNGLGALLGASVHLLFPYPGNDPH